MAHFQTTVQNEDVGSPSNDIKCILNPGGAARCHRNGFNCGLCVPSRTAELLCVGCRSAEIIVSDLSGDWDKTPSYKAVF